MSNNKMDLDLRLFARILYPRHVVLATCVGNNGNPNIIALSFSMPVSYEPPAVVISVAVKHHSHRLIEETMEFTINVPEMYLAKETILCGRMSGRKYDKFKESGLTPMPAKFIKPPLIKECIAHLECKVEKIVTIGDHSLFIGDVLAAAINAGSFDYDKQFINLQNSKPLLAPIDVRSGKIYTYNWELIIPPDDLVSVIQRFPQPRIKPSLYT